MPEIVLSTLNAKYIHASFGLRYLLANLGSLRGRAALAEFDINQRPIDIAEALLALEPRIIGLGVYIWNAEPTAQVVQILKRVRPEVTIILGGPEVSYETDQQPICALADYVITGEADLKFAEVCAQILEGTPPGRRTIAAELPKLEQVALPYHEYTADDVAHRIVYVEASRGCPFTCEFCLSSLDVPVRAVPLEAFLAAMEDLMRRGVRHFKFVDRTFNLNLQTSRRILEFFLARHEPGRFYHFEMIPDRLPGGLREIIARFPPGSLQFEVGIQTFNPEVGSRIQRRQNHAQLEENLKFLRRETGVHVHADLIVGLPGETVRSFAEGFDRLVSYGPQEIQVGILKRLRGTPIIRHDAEWEMVYSANTPYEILRTKTISFAEMQTMRRFARHWDLVVNSGNFAETAPLLWTDGGPFNSFLAWSGWLHGRVGRTHGIALSNLAEHLFEYLVRMRTQDPREVAAKLLRDYQRGGRSDVPVFLREHLPTVEAATLKPRLALKRQSRHAVAAGSQ